jgi:hypothetical protein
MTTSADLLAAANAAYLKVLTSQEYQGPGGRRQRLADLSQIRQSRKELMDEIGNESTGSMCSLLSLGEASL